MSTPARRAARPAPTTKPPALRVLAQARLSHSTHPAPPSLTPTPTVASDIGEAHLCETFRLHRQQHQLDASKPDASKPDASTPDTKRRRIAYTREQKLGAIAYSTTTYKHDADGSPKLISRYRAAQNLGITDTMLYKWQKDRSLIESSSEGTRKNRPHGGGGAAEQANELEVRLGELFGEARRGGKRGRGRFWAVADRLTRELGEEIGVDNGRRP